MPAAAAFAAIAGGSGKVKGIYYYLPYITIYLPNELFVSKYTIK